MQMQQMQQEQQSLQLNQANIENQAQAITLHRNGLSRGIVPQEVLAAAIQNDVVAQQTALGMPQR